MWKGTLLIAATLAILAGCSGGAPASSSETAAQNKPSTPSAAPPTKLKVALLTPGPVSDAGWSSMAYSGLKAIEKDLGAEVNNKESKDAQIADDMRSYAQQGYSLVIGHGYEYNEPAVKTAKDFPNTVFVSSSGSGSSANSGAFRFSLEESFYLAGMLAAELSKTGKIAMIGGPDVPSIRSTFKAFRAGALAVKPSIEVKETFTGQNNDIAAAKQATLAAIGQGADYVIHQANAGAQGVFDACKEKGVLAFGANLDQNDNSSGVVIASAVIVAQPAFVALANQVKNGTYKGGVIKMGMKEKAVDFVVNPKLSGKISPDQRARIDDATIQILSGALKVPMDQF